MPIDSNRKFLGVRPSTRSEYQNTVNEHQLLRKELLPVIGPLMKVNGVPLTRKEITTEAHPYATLRPTLTFTEAAYVRTTRTLLLHQAAHKEIKCPSRIAATAQGEANEEALMRALIDAAVPRIGPDEATCRTFYFGSSYQFRDQDLFEASHILLTADPSDKLACNEAVSRAELLIDELAQAPERFGLLARRWSNLLFKVQRRSSGRFCRGRRREKLGTFLYGAGGKSSPVPIKSQLGVHVVQLDKRTIGNMLTFEHAQTWILRLLTEWAWCRNLASYIDKLVNEAEMRRHLLCGRAAT